MGYTRIYGVAPMVMHPVGAVQGGSKADN